MGATTTARKNSEGMRDPIPASISAIGMVESMPSTKIRRIQDRGSGAYRSLM